MADERIQHTPPESRISVTDQPIDLMVEQVSDLIGGRDSPDDRERALAYLDRASDWMNGVGIYLFRRKTETYTSADADFSTGSTTLTTPTDWGWPTDGARTLLDGKMNGALEWLDWHVFQFQKERSFNSRPEWLSIRSELDDVIHLYPQPDTSKVDTIEIPYTARVQRPSEADSFLITPESREAMLCGAEAFAMRMRHSTKPAVWQPFWVQFERMLTHARDAAWRYRMVVHTNARPDEVGYVGNVPISQTGPANGAIFIAL